MKSGWIIATCPGCGKSCKRPTDQPITKASDRICPYCDSAELLFAGRPR